MFLKIALLFGTSVYLVFCQTTTEPSFEFPEHSNETVYYFSYDANMLEKRIRISCPSVKKIGAALLEDYRLDFYSFSQRWQAPVATIVPTAGASLYGVLWEIREDHLDRLDERESFMHIRYKRIELNVTARGHVVEATTFTMSKRPKFPYNYNGTLYEIRSPSKTYLKCLVKGALESDLPTEYIEWLKSVEHNGELKDDWDEYLEIQDVPLYL